MRAGKVLASALQFFVSILLMGAGAFVVTLSLIPYAKSLFFNLFTQLPELFSLVGYITLGLGILLFIGFYAINRGQFYQVRMQAPKTSIDTSLIEDYARSYWKGVFPMNKINTEVFLHSDQQIELIAEIPEVSPEEQKKLLQKTEKELGALLAKNLGYEREFLVTLLVK